MNLPSERLVLTFGAALAAAAYAYGVARPGRTLDGLSGTASGRALVVLGAMLLLALILRASNRIGGPPPDS